jgi:hypothetical protein
MKYFVDCEFDGHNGALLSIALVSEAGRSLYLIIDEREAPVFDPWVRDNVLSVIDDYGDPDVMRRHVRLAHVGTELRVFMVGDNDPVVVADSPVDIGRFCAAFMTDPQGGYLPNTWEHIAFEVCDIDCYPTSLPGAVQHNAWWDAMALREKLKA